MRRIPAHREYRVAGGGTSVGSGGDGDAIEFKQRLIDTLLKDPNVRDIKDRVRKSLRLVVVCNLDYRTQDFRIEKKGAKVTVSLPALIWKDQQAKFINPTLESLNP